MWPSPQQNAFVPQQNVILVPVSDPSAPILIPQNGAPVPPIGVPILMAPYPQPPMMIHPTMMVAPPQLMPIPMVQPMAPAYPQMQYVPQPQMELQAPLVPTAPSSDLLIFEDETKVASQMSKLSVKPKDTNSITFTLNGNTVTVQNPDPTMTLNTYLREELNMTGTKVTCAEGGCGACTVMLTRFDNTTQQDTNIAINSCLRPLCSLNGQSITTVEGIGSSKKGFHPVQQRLAECNGSQCGWCSPGMVMSMYSLLEENSQPTAQEIEDRFDGNLCRCTGYRQILDAMQSFAVDGKCEPKKKSCGKGKLPDMEDLCTPQFEKYDHSKNKAKKTNSPRNNLMLRTQANGVSWYSPTTLTSLYQLLNENNGVPTKLVVGNTSSGLPYQDPAPSVIIDLTGIPDLAQASLSSSGAVFGSTVTISDMMNLLTSYANSTQYPTYQTQKFNTLVNHMKKIANFPVRNAASWAGNLMVAHNHGDFPSDMYTIMLGAGATLSIGSSSGVQNGVDLMSFLNVDMTGQVILSITIPLGNQNEFFSTYKAMIRHENSHALVNAAFRLTVDSNNNVVGQPTIAYGGIVPFATRITALETALIGQTVTSNTTFQNALTILGQVTIDPTPGRVAYRTSLLNTFFYKFWLTLQPSLPSSLQSVVNPFTRPVSSGVQSFQTSPSEYPVSEPIPKLSAMIQASGEAKYTADAAPLPGTLYAAHVTATMASATIASIDASAALQIPGVVAFYSAADLPADKNAWGPQIQDEEVFASTQVNYYGQPIGLIIADSQELAIQAAQAVVVNYTNVQTPILTLEDAINNNSFFPNYPQFPTGSPVQSGNVDQGFANSATIINGSVSMGTQYHFTMETQSVYCVPQENNQMKVIGSLQWAAFVQQNIASFLGKNNSDITVETMRLGGGYGAKITRNVLPYLAVAWAADQLNVPVKMHMSLHTNMDMIGKRHPFIANYKVGVDSSGKLQAIQMTLYCDGGYSLDASNGTVSAALYAIDNVYYCPNTYYEGYLAKTNLPPNTSTRGPGWIQAIFIAEHIMEHLAVVLNVPPAQIKELNFYQRGQVTPYGEKLPYFNIPTIWDQLQESAQYQSRLSQIQAFNTANRWTKRGLSLVPIKFGLYWGPGNPQGTIINVYPDGTVSFSTSGIEMGQGLFTKVAQAIAMSFNIPLSLIRVKDTSTLTVPGASATGGSVGSETCVQSALLACGALNERLAPIRAKMQNPTWQELIAKAASTGMDLQTKGWFNPGPSPIGPQQYSTYAAACSEVEIDVLTGEIQILRNDILFDCGVSMNPGVDIGQIIGGFTMGLGYHLMEELLIDSSDNSGALISNGTWEYKIPGAKDIPIDWRVSLLKNSNNPLGILGSKAVGEPPLALSCALLFAAKHAVTAARSDVSLTGYFDFNSPATVDQIQQACSVEPSQFYFQ